EEKLGYGFRRYQRSGGIIATTGFERKRPDEVSRGRPAPDFEAPSVHVRPRPEEATPAAKSGLSGSAHATESAARPPRKKLQQVAESVDENKGGGYDRGGYGSSGHYSDGYGGGGGSSSGVGDISATVLLSPSVYSEIWSDVSVLSTQTRPITTTCEQEEIFAAAAQEGSVVARTRRDVVSVVSRVDADKQPTETAASVAGPPFNTGTGYSSLKTTDIDQEAPWTKSDCSADEEQTYARLTRITSRGTSEATVKARASPPPSPPVAEGITTAAAAVGEEEELLAEQAALLLRLSGANLYTPCVIERLISDAVHTPS
ncbi:unnamed protein product, partial [Pylaiella littoralis]